MRSKPFTRWAKVLLALLTVSVVLLQGCTPPASVPTQDVAAPPTAAAPADTQAPTETQPVETAVPTGAAIPTGGTLRLVSLQEPDTLDPHKTAMSVSALVMSMFGGSLVFMDHNNQIIPYHASSWTVSDDGLVYTFNLRQDIKFQDGTPLTANDYVWTYQRAANPETASPVAGGFLVNMQSVEALDDYTLRITLIQPKYTFLYDLTSSDYLQPLPQAKVEEMGDQFGRTPVGTGPFIVTGWQTSNVITLVRNPDFAWAPQGYNPGPAYIDGIEFKMIPDEATIAAGLEAGEIDVADLQPRDVDRFRESGFQIITGEYQGFGPGIIMNVDAPPFDDVRIRQALNYAINREGLVTVILQDQGSAQYGPLSPAEIGYWPGVEEIGQHYDPARVEELIQSAGYAKNADGIYEKDGVALDFSVLTASGFADWTKTLEILQSELIKMGIKISINTVDVGILVEKCFAGDYTLSMMGIGAREADIMYDMFHSANIDGGLNLSRISDPELDTLLEQSRTATDGAARQEILNQIQRIIVEQAYVIPLYAGFYFTAVNPRVHDLHIKNGVNYYFDVYISE